MIKKLFMLAVTSGLAAKALHLWIDREARRQDRRRGLDRTEVQRWDDEGGNLPDTPPAAPSTPASKPRPARKAAARRPRSGGDSPRAA